MYSTILFIVLRSDHGFFGSGSTPISADDIPTQRLIADMSHEGAAICQVQLLGVAGNYRLMRSATHENAVNVRTAMIIAQIFIARTRSSTPSCLQISPR